MKVERGVGSPPTKLKFDALNGLIIKEKLLGEVDTTTPTL